MVKAYDLNQCSQCFEVIIWVRPRRFKSCSCRGIPFLRFAPVGALDLMPSLRWERRPCGLRSFVVLARDSGLTRWKLWLCGLFFVVVTQYCTALYTTPVALRVDKYWSVDRRDRSIEHRVPYRLLCSPAGLRCSQVSKSKAMSGMVGVIRCELISQPQVRQGTCKPLFAHNQDWWVCRPPR